MSLELRVWFVNKASERRISCKCFPPFIFLFYFILFYFFFHFFFFFFFFFFIFAPINRASNAKIKQQFIMVSWSANINSSSWWRSKMDLKCFHITSFFYYFFFPSFCYCFLFSFNRLLTRIFLALLRTSHHWL